MSPLRSTKTAIQFQLFLVIRRNHVHVTRPFSIKTSHIKRKFKVRICCGDDPYTESKNEITANESSSCAGGRRKSLQIVWRVAGPVLSAVRMFQDSSFQLFGSLSLKKQNMSVSYRRIFSVRCPLCGRRIQAEIIRGKSAVIVAWITLEWRWHENNWIWLNPFFIVFPILPHIISLLVFLFPSFSSHYYLHQLLFLKMTVFWCLAPCSLVPWAAYSQSWWWRQQPSLKRL